jgi:hypothetical protein
MPANVTAALEQFIVDVPASRVRLVADPLTGVELLNVSVDDPRAIDLTIDPLLTIRDEIIA